MHMYDGTCWEMASGQWERVRDRVIVHLVRSRACRVQLDLVLLRHGMLWED